MDSGENEHRFRTMVKVSAGSVELKVYERHLNNFGHFYEVKHVKINGARARKRTRVRFLPVFELEIFPDVDKPSNTPDKIPDDTFFQ